MDIIGPLAGDGGFPFRLLTVPGAVIMAHEQPGFIRQRQYRHQTVIKLRRTAPREIRARGSGIGLHEGVMHKGRIADDIGNGTRRMPRRQHHPALQLTQRETVALGKQPVEMARRIESAGHVIDLFPQRGDSGHAFADGIGCAGLLLQPGRGHQVIGMGVGVQYPGQHQPATFDLGQRPPGRVMAARGAARIEFLHHVDQRRLFRHRAGHKILATPGRLVVKAGHIGGTGALRRALPDLHDPPCCCLSH